MFWRELMVVLVVSVVLAACRATMPPPQPSISGGVTAEAGPALIDLDDGAAGMLGHDSWDDYVAEVGGIQSAKLAKLGLPYPGASSGARYGINILSGADKNVSWVVDGDPIAGYWLVFDANGNGDLTDERVWRLERTGKLWRVEVRGLPRTAGGAPLRAVITFDGVNVHSYTSAVRSGTFHLGDRTVKFSITCPYGDCSERRAVRVGLDLDGNGTIDSAVGSYEQFKLGESVVVVGKSYELTVAPDGSSLTLRPAQRSVAPRPTLAIGDEAPAFEVADATARFSLAAERGKVVVIDFVSEACHFCVLDQPWLSGVYERLSGSGLDIVTIGEGSLAYSGQAWPAIIEPAGAPDEPGPVGARYRVGAFPTYFVVDRAGKIVCSHCLHGDVDRTLGALFATGR